MRLQNKLALYNAVSKILIILFIGLSLPKLIEKVIYNHIDNRLYAEKNKVYALIKKGGLDQIILEEDCSFGNYNLLKEEFIAIEPIKGKVEQTKIENAERDIEGEIVTHRVLSQPFFYDNQYYVLEIGEGLSAIQDLNRKIREFIIIVLLIVIVVTIVLDIGFSKLILKPFNIIIQRKLKPVEHPSLFNTKAIKSSTFEFNVLDSSINDLMTKIKDAFLVEKEFIANVSHELLTPISILQTRLENLIVEDAVSEEVSIKIVDSLQVLNRLTKIIKALLLISKIENDQYARTDSVLVTELIDNVLKDIEERFAEKGIALKNNIDKDFNIEHCNKHLLYILFYNLINNSIKYNNPGGSIELNSEETNESFIIKIKDTGIGIEKENLSAIFNRFRKFNERDSNSHGLGLPIVKSILEFHKYDINVESRKNEGSVFSIIFHK